MTNEQKLQHIRKTNPEIPEKEAKYMVKLVNWITKYQDILEVMHRNYTAETKDELPFMGFAQGVYHEDKTLPKYYLQHQIENN